MSEIWTAQSPTSHLSKIFMECLKDQFTYKWNSNLNNATKGRNYGNFKERIQLENYLLKLSPKFYTLMAKFQTANHRFPCEVLRWQNIEISDRKCHLCDKQDVSDEMHYLHICPYFSEERKRFVKRYYFAPPPPPPNTLKFKQLLNTKNIQDLSIRRNPHENCNLSISLSSYPNNKTNETKRICFECSNEPSHGDSFGQP